jgi:hypothetical protein
MTSSDATMLYYRGYFIESRLCEGTATDSIRRPDGSWRASPPSFVTGPWEVWVVIRSGPAGALEEVGILNSEGAARKLIDELNAAALVGAK